MSFGITKNTKQYKWQYLYYADLELFLALDAVRTLAQNQEDKLNEVTKDLKQKIEIELVFNSSNYNSNMILDERLNSALYIHHRYSSFIGIFSMFESNLKTLCVELINQQKTSMRMNQYYSKEKGYLESYWGFLNGIYSFCNIRLLESFEYLNNHRIIRNIIVHNNGIAKSNEVIKIQNLNYISITKESNQIIINNRLFLFNVIDEIEFFYKLLLVEIDKAQ